MVKIAENADTYNAVKWQEDFLQQYRHFGLSKMDRSIVLSSSF